MYTSLRTHRYYTVLSVVPVSTPFSFGKLINTVQQRKEWDRQEEMDGQGQQHSCTHKRHSGRQTGRQQLNASPSWIQICLLFWRATFTWWRERSLKQDLWKWNQRQSTCWIPLCLPAMQLYAFTAWDLHQSPYEQYTGMARLQNSMQSSYFNDVSHQLSFNSYLEENISLTRILWDDI